MSQIHCIKVKEYGLYNYSLELQFSNILVSETLQTLKNYRGLPKSFGLCGLYLSIFTIIEMNREILNIHR